MRLDIQRLLAENGSETDFDFSFPVNVLDDVKEAKAHAKGAVKNHGGYMELNAKLSVKGTGICARCCADVPLDMCFSVSRPVAKAGYSGDDDYAVADEDGFLSLLPLFEEELLLQFPTKLLCSPDCKGLCSRCGADLNKGPCGCPKREINPQLAVLKKLLEEDSSED